MEIKINNHDSISVIFDTPRDRTASVYFIHLYDKDGVNVGFIKYNPDTRAIKFGTD